MGRLTGVGNKFVLCIGLICLKAAGFYELFGAFGPSLVGIMVLFEDCSSSKKKCLNFHGLLPELEKNGAKLPNKLFKDWSLL